MILYDVSSYRQDAKIAPSSFTRLYSFATQKLFSNILFFFSLFNTNPPWQAQYDV
jgi:hypothetical protein